METGLLRGLVAFRWAAWLWIATVTFLNRDQLARPGLLDRPIAPFQPGEEPFPLLGGLGPGDVELRP